MLAIEVEYLMGRAVATAWHERTSAEWPPHPQRLFSALVATHFELGLGEESEAALRWLERLPPPEIRATDTPWPREILSHWVPVNDEAIKIEKGKFDPRHPLERRNRQERHFPTVGLEDPVVVFQWPEASGADAHRPALRTLVENLTYLGHSSSPVRACLLTEPVEPTFKPAPEGDLVLRIPGPGRFDRLCGIHALRLEDESIQPPLGRTQIYTSQGCPPCSVFSSNAIVLAFESGPRLCLDSTLPLMQHLRAAVLARLGNAPSEVLTGHREDGSASPEPHLAFVPLAHVSGPYADGSLKGAALVLPRNADQATRVRLHRALVGAWPLHLGPLGSLTVRTVDEDEADLVALRFDRYIEASRCWASVTPVVLDRHPKSKGPTVEEIIAESCSRIGLPEPVEVRHGAVSAIRGAPRASDFHGRGKQVDGRVRRHVWLRFDRKVCGPMLLGAGRFLGLGLCRPVSDEGAA